MARRLVLIGGLLALVLTGTAQAAARPKYLVKGAQVRSELMPGVTYEKGVQFTPHGPVAFHLITGPRPGGLYELRPVLSNETITGRETVSSMSKRMASRATVAGVNGDLFRWDNGRPTGVFMTDRVLANPPYGDRSSVGVQDDGTVDVRRVEFFGTWRGTGQRRVLNDLNQAAGANGISLFTQAYGAVTPYNPGAVEAVVFPLPPTTPNTDLIGPVMEIARNGNTPIPPGGAVLQARGTAGQRLAEEAAPGTEVTVRLILRPEWTGVAHAIGGGPVLVRNGGPVFRSFEAFSPDQLLPRNPRTAVGQLADGRVMLLATDGRQPGYSVGMTNFELAQTMARLGAVRASALDAGGSTTMVFEGEVLNRPSNGGGRERAVAESLMLMYYGVYAPPPGEPVVSPNGDGVAERQSLAYKVVRPSNVVATLVAPDGTPAWTETVTREAGTYAVAFPPPPPPPAEEPPPETPPAGAPSSRARRAQEEQPPAEGRWRLDVRATDDQGRESQTTRTFTVNNTLSRIALSRARLYVPPRGRNLFVGFSLSRPARVVLTIETRAGAVVRTLATRRYPAGRVRLSWNGLQRGNKVRAFGGRYVARVVARNALGRVELTKAFSVQRIAGPPMKKAKPGKKTRR